MPVTVGVLRSPDPHERRVPIVPDVARKLSQLGASVVMQRGATDGAYMPAADYQDVQWVEHQTDVLRACDVLWTVGPPEDAALRAMRPGQVMIGLLQPYGSAQRVQLLREARLTTFALELLPRVSRAQSMDVLTSQGAAAGYQCVLIAAHLAPKFFPMLTYAAGTIRPARVLVIGAGVAGLQAIATARRLGALVEAYDVRPETREQVESLGAKFVDTGVRATGAGGYARELTDDEKHRQAVKLAQAVAQADVLITTAAVPGRRAPRIITADMIAAMKPGAVVVDMAAESGGNVEGTVAGQEVTVGPARLVGPLNLPSRMPVHASEMLSRNLLNFTQPMLHGGELHIDWHDDVVRGTAFTHAGEVTHEVVRQALGLDARAPSA